MQILKFINSAIFFLLEIVMFIALAFVGSQLGKSTLTKWLIGIILPVIALVLWGYLAAPKSEYRLELNLRIVFELVMFSATAFLLYRTPYKTVAIVFLITSLVIVIASYFFER